MINLHILGVQKAGTTALASFLHQHPDIYVVDGKEAHVFDHPTFAQRANKPRIARLEYQKRLSEYNGQRIICDATPITLYREEFLRECVAYNPNAKFIVMLRDPVERAISHYQMSKAKQLESRSMLMAFLLERWRLRKVHNASSWPYTSPLRIHSYLSRGLYKRQLQNLFQLVSEEQVLVVEQTELKNHHQATLNRIFSFLGLPECGIPAKLVFTSEDTSRHWSDGLAIAYAKFYFKLWG